ncbi:MAG: 50S ribosomal protein L33 [bacterium]|nr:50S ribosomal protein L33 [bacterium]MDZ4296076.1 50S ribosomal protein L33 [Patescibacteria group bacterium]
MAAKKTLYVKMACATCKRVNYHAKKNTRKVERKLELRKFCAWCRMHVVHKEARK